MNYADVSKRFPEHREELEERAGILQYDCQMRKDIAEEEAARIIVKKYKLFAPERFR